MSAMSAQRAMDLFAFDAGYQAASTMLCGVDEAGRGPLAGDVYAAAVILPPDCRIEGLNDSKRLSSKRREQLYGEITQSAVSWCVATASVEEIERYNILGATFLAMRRAVEGLAALPALALIDGNREPPLPCKAECVVGGDGKSASIAAASILAKVERDRYMLSLHERYPQYRFDKHKGYGTGLHIELIRRYGPCQAHRQRFLRNITE